jgi:hypothetical protein
VFVVSIRNCWSRAVTVKVPSTHRHQLGIPLSCEEPRGHHLWYHQAGSYRVAAVVCSTTHKAVKCVVETLEAGAAASPRVERVRNFDAVTEWSASGWLSQSGDLGEAVVADRAGSRL